MIKIISAIGINGEYSFKGRLPWPSSFASKADMKFFREYTTGKTIIMGYKTWISIGKPLPNRLNIVIGKDDPVCDVIFIDSLEMALKQYPNAIVIGGLSLIKTMITKHIHIVEEIIINRFRESFSADMYFDIKNIPMIFQSTEHEYYTQLRYFWPN